MRAGCAEGAQVSGTPLHYLPPAAPARCGLSVKQLARMAFRIELFQQHGWGQERAERWAGRLVARDADKDDRRLCVECKNLLNNWRCAKRGAVVADQLQRCASFTWNAPKQ